MKTAKLSVMLLGVILLSSFIFPGSNDTSNISRNKKDKTVEFRIQLCAYYESVPVKEVELMRTIGGVSSIKVDGKSTYVTAPFASEEAARQQLPTFQAIGFSGAEQIVTVKDNVLSMEDYYKEFEIQPSGENTTVPVIRIWK